MKILKTVFIVFLVLILILSIGIFVFVKTFDVNKYKPQILKEVTKTLGRNAAIDSLGLNFSLMRGIALDIKGLAISDNPRFSKENFLTVPSISVGVDISSFLTKRQMVVSSLQLQSPKIVLIRNEQGVWNVQTFEINKEKTAFINNRNNTSDVFSIKPWTSEAYAAGPVAPASPSPQTAMNLPAFLIQSIQLDNGMLAYIDKTFDPQVSIEINRIDLKVNDFSLARASDLSIRGSLWSDRQNIVVDGRIKLDIEKGAVHFSDTKVSFDLSSVSAQELLRSLEMLKSAGLEKSLGGRLEATIKEIEAGRRGLSKVSLSGKLSGGKVKIKYLALPLEDIHVDFEMSGKKVDVKNFAFHLGKGIITAEGQIDDYLKEQNLHFETEAEGLDLSEIISQKDQPVEFRGKLNAKFSVKTKGPSSDTASLLKNLAGTGTMEVKEGKLIGINILRLVLDKISMLPGLVEKIESQLSDKFKEQLEANDTVFQGIEFEADVKGGGLQIKKANAQSDLFTLSGEGRLGFNLDLEMRTVISIPQDLSKDMTAGEEKLKYLFDQTRQITIPVLLSGTIPDITPFPDLRYLAERIIANKGVEELEKALDKALGGEGSSKEKETIKKIFGTIFGEEETTPEETPQNKEVPRDQNQPEEKKSSEEELIQSIFDKILR